MPLSLEGPNFYRNLGFFLAFYRINTLSCSAKSQGDAK